MRTRYTLITVLGLAYLVVAGCGGSGGTGASAAAPSAAAPAAAASPAAGGGTDAGSQPSVAASAAVAAPQEPAGGGPAGTVCELVTAEELQGILGTPVSLTVFAGPPDTCDIQSTDGAPLAATVLTVMSSAAASAVFDAYAGSPGAQSISGMGDKAAYDPAQAVLVVLKGDKVLTVAVFDDGTTDEAARLELMKQIGSIAAGRM